MIKNEYNRLKSCIVGREFSLNPKMFDISFKTFFKNNLEDLDYVQELSQYYTSEKIHERNEDLDNLAKVIESFNVKVYRPLEVDKIIKIKTPTFESICRPSSNVRDQCLIYGNTIFETAPNLRGRYFENYTLYNIFNTLYKNGMNWIQCPKSNLTDESIDTNDWRAERDFTNIPSQYEMFFDSANCLKLNNDILYNYSTYNHYLGIKWLKDNVNANIIPVRVTDNHIDGNIISLCEGTLLVNDKKLKTRIENLLPKKFKEYEFLRLPNNVIMEDEVADTDVPKLASREGMSINVFSIDEKTVIVNECDTPVCELLDRNGFNVVPVKLRHCRMFGGGIHCSTLDIERD